MLFLFAVISMFGYTIQGTFLVKYARSVDEFSLTVYRNISLGITMLPVFFLVDFSDFANLGQVWNLLIPASLFGLIGLVLSLRSTRSLPVGINATFGQSQVLLLLLWSYLFLGETISWTEFLAIQTVLLGAIFLSLQNHHMPHLDGRTKKGILLKLISSFFASLAFFLMSVAARQVNPLLVGYLWELLIGIFAAGTVITRSQFHRGELQHVPRKTLWRIILISGFTLFGTTGFVLAVQYGPIGIVSAVSSTGVVLGVLLSHFLYHEHLDRKQWLGIFIVIFGVVGLKLA